jgi:hypothetical protein
MPEFCNGCVKSALAFIRTGKGARPFGQPGMVTHMLPATHGAVNV